MDLIGEEEGRLERLSAWFEASRAEMVGLALLLIGAVVATGALWWTIAGADPGPAEIAGPDDTTVGTGPTDPLESDGGQEVSEPPDANEEESSSEVTVHVTGAVGEPGVVTVAAGARVAEVIAAAGEASAQAELELLNLARVVTDGEQVHVPKEGEEPPPEASALSHDTADGDGPIDLNHADAGSLEQLPGIGPARAAAIVEHREAHGPFSEPGDLRDVPGIGEATFQRLAEQVTTS